MHTTRRRFIFAATASGLALATLDPAEAVRRFWQGWRPSGVGLRVDAPQVSDLLMQQELEAYELLSNSARLIGGSGGRTVTFRTRGLVLPGDLVSLSQSGTVARLAALGDPSVSDPNEILGVATDRAYGGEEGACVTVQVSGFVRIDAETLDLESGRIVDGRRAGHHFREGKRTIRLDSGVRGSGSLV